LFALPDRRTYASRNIGAVVERAVRWSQQGLDVYGHTHLHELPEGDGNRRGSTGTARVAIAVYADIDALGPGRKKSPETLCPRVAAAISVVETFNAQYWPLQVALLIGSGYGCYPAIPFKEPLLLHTAEDRRLLESLSRRFHGALHQIAAERSWTGAVDFADAARVLRLAGCLNFKDPTRPKPVRILYETEARFTFSDLDELLPQPTKQAEQPEKISSDTMPNAGISGSIVLNPNANPPKDLFELTIELDPPFKYSWDHQRIDLRDTSQSGWDMSLATRAVGLGCPDQAVVDLVISNRRKFGARPKPASYYWRTLAKAKASAARGETHG
jgi:hypothetical protein